jgi:hypothetical protein
MIFLNLEDDESKDFNLANLFTIPFLMLSKNIWNKFGVTIKSIILSLRNILDYLINIINNVKKKS